jgi:phenylacetate-CoA ligase
LHCLEESNVVEIPELDNFEPISKGSVGRVVVTNPDNFAQPFVRYDVGDLAEWVAGECPCGRQHSMLRIRGGRIGDVITGPSVRILHSEVSPTFFYQHRGIRQFQVEQESPGRMIIRVAVGPGYDREGTRHRVT